ncbi:MAG: Rrf2 family transcriptional regulator [Nitrospiraceae bacterium]
MKFSKKSEYGLRALLELAGAGDETSPPDASSSTRTFVPRLLQRHDIGQRQRIPVEFLEQILLALKRAGIVASQRGARGGYRLIKSPEEITVGQIIRILDGPLAPIACVSVTAYQTCQDCPHATASFCPIQVAMRDVRDAIADILDHYTLAQMAASGPHTRPGSPAAAPGAATKRAGSIVPEKRIRP